MEIVAEYFFVNSKYENMKSERVEGLTYWEKQQRRLEEYFSLFDVLLLWIIGILGPNENFFRVNNTKLLYNESGCSSKNFFLQWREWNAISKFKLNQHPRNL